MHFFCFFLFQYDVFCQFDRLPLQRQKKIDDKKSNY